MAKILRCNDLMPGCDFVARGNSEEEIMAQAAEHAKTVHNMTEIPEGVVAMVRGAIREEDQARAQSTSS
jgi:predicted small metal-binding protein